jgi:putative ATP-binding cassette transporter
LNHLSDSETNANKSRHVVVTEHGDNTITAKNLSIKTPQGDMLLENINQEFIKGESYVIKGESGIGKSTFVRTIAGIWPFASGDISFPSKVHVMYLPQKAYMPIGTLAEAILFPDKHDPSLESKLQKVMHDCHLDSLVPRLHETAHWSEQLSPGEQQRVAFARVLLHKPDWVFLDESTSMLDLANEKHMYTLLKEQLPNCTLISVGHHSGVDEFHNHTIEMTQYRHEEPAIV